MSRPGGGSGWSLEVVRGREVGRRFPISRGSVVLGNATGNGEGGGSGIDLSSQEGDSPRKMAARQAVVELGPAGPVLRDLESPGGTFVNRRRLLPDQGQPLRQDDLIQLGSVQLRVVAPGPEPTPSTPTGPSADRARRVAETVATIAPASPSRPAETPRAASPAASLAFSMKDGPVCRSWDDFLTVSAQRWGALREELTSGRLAAYLAATGRAGLAPRADAPGSPDDRLDSWLGSLPTNRPARPELEVHPRTLAVRATPGVRTRRTLRVSNVGFRLLRSKARVEPEGTRWLTLAPEFAREFATVEETELAIEVAVPDPFPGRLSASVVIEGNGGTARIAVVLDPAESRPTEPFGSVEPAGEGPPTLDAVWRPIEQWLSRRGARGRLIGGAVAGLLSRLGIGVASGLSGTATLPGPAIVLSVTCAVAGAFWAGRRGGARDVPAGAFAGGFGGLIGSALVVALCQAVEPMLGDWLSGNLVAVALLWAALGAAIGGVSLLLVPERRGGTP